MAVHQPTCAPNLNLFWGIETRHNDRRSSQGNSGGHVTQSSTLKPKIEFKFVDLFAPASHPCNHFLPSSLTANIRGSTFRKQRTNGPTNASKWTVGQLRKCLEEDRSAKYRLLWNYYCEKVADNFVVFYQILCPNENLRGFCIRRWGCPKIRHIFGWNTLRFKVWLGHIRDMSYLVHSCYFLLQIHHVIWMTSLYFKNSVLPSSQTTAVVQDILL